MQRADSTRSGPSRSTSTPTRTSTELHRGAIGGSLTWGYELTGLAWLIPAFSKLDDLRVFGTYTLERVRVTSAVQDILLYNRFRSGVTSALGFSVSWDRRDNRLFPTSGFYLSAGLDLAPPFLAPEAVFGSQVNLFYRETLEFRFYQDIFQGLVGRFRLLAGVVRGWDENHPVPVSELYYLGGVNTIRGYQLYTISPSALVGSTANPDATMRLLQVGGNKQLVLNFELEYPHHREDANPGRGLLRHGQRLRARVLHGPLRVVVALQVLGLRLPLVQPHRAAPLRMGLPARPAQGPSPAPTSMHPSTSSSPSAASSDRSERRNHASCHRPRRPRAGNRRSPRRTRRRARRSATSTSSRP